MLVSVNKRLALHSSRSSTTLYGFTPQQQEFYHMHGCVHDSPVGCSHGRAVDTEQAELSIGSNVTSTSPDLASVAFSGNIGPRMLKEYCELHGISERAIRKMRQGMMQGMMAADPAPGAPNSLIRTSGAGQPACTPRLGALSS